MKDKRVIETFGGENKFLSNFHPSIILVDGITFPTAEHLYQSLKTEDIEERLQISNAKTPGTAKRMGRRVQLRENWEEVKVEYMFFTLREKFRQNPSLAKKLLATDNAMLSEGNWWHDNFWGDCKCRKCTDKIGIGCNYLGRLLMQVREELNEG